jgi:hypothetical protein
VARAIRRLLDRPVHGRGYLTSRCLSGDHMTDPELSQAALRLLISDWHNTHDGNL